MEKYFEEFAERISNSFANRRRKTSKCTSVWKGEPENSSDLQRRNRGSSWNRRFVPVKILVSFPMTWRKWRTLSRKFWPGSVWRAWIHLGGTATMFPCPFLNRARSPENGEIQDCRSPRSRPSRKPGNAQSPAPPINKKKNAAETSA